MNKYVERVRNLIRVVSATPDEKFDIRYWWNPSLGCGCAIGHAMHDGYFIKRGLGVPPGPNTLIDVSKFFDISLDRAIGIFVCHPYYTTRQDVLASLRILLLEKEAVTSALDTKNTVEFLASDIKDEIAADIEAQLAL